MPKLAEMPELTRAAYECSPLKSPEAEWGSKSRYSLGPEDLANPVPMFAARPSPIKHCIYIIKENRTYDQVFGDMTEGNGDAKLCLFREKVTPNQHSWPGSSCCWTISMWTAKCRPTATNGRWGPTPPISWRRSGR